MTSKGDDIRLIRIQLSTIIISLSNHKKLKIFLLIVFRIRKLFVIYFYNYIIYENSLQQMLRITTNMVFFTLTILF